ncbi:hypothetical protein MHK_000886, partial [Candidatus Magnetomorum sp. HK-1]
WGVRNDQKTSVNVMFDIYVIDLAKVNGTKAFSSTIIQGCS